MENFPDRLKKAMQLRGFRQIDLSSKTGIERGTISNYINGKYKPKAKNVIIIAKALGVNSPWLLGAKDVPMEIEPGVDYHISDDDVNTRAYLKMEYSNILEMNVSREERTAFYEKFESLSEQAKIDIVKYMYMVFTMDKFNNEKGGA